MPVSITINSNGNPIIPLGKSDKYIVCSVCKTNISQQFTNCPVCNTANPSPKAI